MFDRLTKTRKLNHLPLEMLVSGGVVFVCFKKISFISLKGVVRFSRSDDGGGKRLVLHFSKMKDTIMLLKGKIS